MPDSNHLQRITLLNQQGFLPSPDENESDYFNRVELLKEWSQNLKQKDLEIEDSDIKLSREKRLDENLLKQKGAKANSLYGILADWVPAYFEDQGLPLFTGGMAMHYRENEDPLWKSFFQLKSVYQKKDRWLIYSSSELISHEMCHVARGALSSKRYEETFAYKTSSSAFRRSIGGALLTPLDNVILILSLVWMLLIDVLSIFIEFGDLHPSWISKAPLCIVVVLGLLRNRNIRKELSAAQNVLSNYFSDNALPVLFRLTDAEIRQLANMKKENFKTFWDQIKNFRGEFLRNLYPLKN